MQSNHVLKIRVSHLHMTVTQWPQSAGTLKQFTRLQHSNFLHVIRFNSDNTDKMLFDQIQRNLNDFPYAFFQRQLISVLNTKVLNKQSNRMMYGLFMASISVPASFLPPILIAIKIKELIIMYCKQRN